MKANEHQYVWVVQGDYRYGDGWENLTTTESYTEARDDLKARRENESGKFRVTRRRQLIPLVLF